ncbi:MAG: histidine--tRNA ligase [Candidatus Hydrogenedentes bacterium]|nr:histidine--tRNA ligase [Candidatus Hydrogenedentota bacterium]
MPEKKKLVEPRTLKGFQDYLPEDVIARRQVVRTIEEVFEKYGFVPLETPALEYLDVVLGTGGEDVNKELFRLESPEGEDISLRFDLTVPFARLLAQYPDKLKVPVRRYAIGPVWRADKPGPGRFRQFTQIDADIAGSASVAVDGEIIAIMVEIMRALGAPSYRVLVNNRKLIDALLDDCGIHEEERQKHVLRVIDKLAKVGLDNIRLELGPGRVDDSGDPIPGARLDDETIDKILNFIGVKGTSRAEVVDNLRELLPDTDLARLALDEMREFAEVLEALGVDEEHAWFDPSLARGLDYYTGPVYETVIPDIKKLGSVMGGGRYNGLVGRFLDREIPATGMSVGLDRLMAALKKLKVLDEIKSTVQVLVVSLGEIPSSETLRIAAELRDAGLRTEAYFGKKMRMKDQLSHADRHGIPVAVILGEDELARGEISVKDLLSGKAGKEHIDDRDEYRRAGKDTQVTVKRSELVATVQRYLADSESA